MMTEPRIWFRLFIFADYHQFYIWNPDTPECLAPTDWTEQDVANRAKAAPGVVVVCPVRNMDVPVVVSLWDAEPPLHLDDWQHIVEAPLATTKRIEIHECTGGPHACFEVEPGEYTVRALYRDLDKLSEDELEGDDFYEVQIWKSPCASLKVVKRWEASKRASAGND